MKRYAKNRKKIRWLWFALFSGLFHLSAFVVLLPLLAVRGAVRIFRDKDAGALKVSLVLALLIHVCILLPLGYWWLRFRDEPVSEDRTVVDLWRETAEEKTPEEELESYEPEAELPELEAELEKAGY